MLVGLYMLGFLGFIAKENMQIEGFFFYLLAGFFAGSVIHYLVAKIFGPMIFGRGWCGWACWTAMVLDFLPFKKSKAGRPSASWEKLRVVHFVLSLLLVLALWFLQSAPRSILLACGREPLLLRFGDSHGIPAEGQPGILQIPMPHHCDTQDHLPLLLT